MSGAKPGADCLNCGAALNGPFCANCGQEADAHRKPLLGLLSDIADNFGNWDSRILRTLSALIFQPGELPLAFTQGRRQRYVPALRLYIFTTVVFFLVLALANIALAQIVWRESPTGAQPIQMKIGNQDITTEHAYISWEFFTPRVTQGIAMPEELRPQFVDMRARNAAATQSGAQAPWMGALNDALLVGISHIFENPSALSGQLADWLPRVLFVLLPLFALLLALFYWRKKLFYVDHLVFALSLHTFFFVLLTIAVLLAQIGSGTVIAWVTLAVFAAYAYFAMKRFYGQSHLVTGIKWAAVGAIYFFALLLPGMLAVLLFSLAGA